MTFMHEYANWHGPLPNRRQRFLEESHHYFCHAFTTAASSLKSAYAKPVLPFPGAEMFFSACFVLSVATCNVNAKEFLTFILKGNFI